ncbi:glycine--tRNA ligase subunit alpha [Candidatus Carsonella ruddii]|uniref:Glycine--tRNA ligase alpha subunit n=1 Tax=Candidatus Carsonella ruddii (Diaphorina cf. continua) TaxID=2661587 RepID=A0A7R6VYH4_CARRU|nr:glycine--tRNA ligase subunit alpha [Candidatus Carsonella ruddii (Diaphorina cf. continua)]BCG49417.1 glycine--tRNA ligase subunit alpha [Candidatus Carsonella ruddii (Diaphorina cf. continua)]
MNIKNKIFSFWKRKNFSYIKSDENKSGAATYCFKNTSFLIKKKIFKIFFLQNCFRQFDSYVSKKNKIYIHQQIQIICKPIPINFLSIYKESLFFLKNLYFKKDNWKSPLIGAKGIGYEVLYNYYEISQITIFNFLGNKKLYSPILEITYGLDRINKIKNKNLIKEKFYSIINIFIVNSFKKILFLFVKSLKYLRLNNFFLSYFYFVKIANKFNEVDYTHMVNNYNRVKILFLIKVLSEKIIKKCYDFYYNKKNFKKKFLFKK